MQKEGMIDLYCNYCKVTEEIMLDRISYRLQTRIPHRDTDRLQIIETDFFVDPVIRQSCPKCGFMEAHYWQGGNRRKIEFEPITYYRCIKCKNTWND
jgi:DNA-directed RNA polymerase subunit M